MIYTLKDHSGWYVENRHREARAEQRDQFAGYYKKSDERNGLGIGKW